MKSNSLEYKLDTQSENGPAWLMKCWAPSVAPSLAPKRLIIAIAFALAFSHLPIETTFGQQIDSVDSPQDSTVDRLRVLEGDIDNRLIYSEFLRSGIAQVESQKQDSFDGLQVSEIADLLAAARNPSLRRPLVDAGADSSHSTANRRESYQRLMRSSLMLGTIYDCGRCDNLHANIAGGVVISKDGLALTNYHVLKREEPGVETLMAMTYDGTAHSIVEVLYANKEADVALIRLSGDGPFTPISIANETPLPTDPVQVISHPSSEYFVLTQGVVSRHVRLGRRQAANWMEITAAFGGGSSGSGVFNEQGELIGLVSRIQPLFRMPNPDSGAPANADSEKQEGENLRSTRPYVEMVLRRCVSLEAIHNCFKSGADVQ